MGTKRSDRQLTPRQKKFVEALVKTDNVAEAARLAGYSLNHPENAAQAGNQVLKAVQSRSREAMDAKGWTFDELIDKHLGLVIEAKEHKFFPFRKIVRIEEVKDKEGKVLKPAREETKQIINRVQVINLQTKATGLDIAFKLRGDYAPKKPDTEPGSSEVPELINVAGIPRFND